MPSRAAHLCQYKYKQTPLLSFKFKPPELDLNSGGERKNKGGLVPFLTVLGRGMNHTIPYGKSNYGMPSLQEVGRELHPTNEELDN
ncbi:hypothetical protein SADUNF_Sadunf14G0046400 [Salix dunnii]|uniref:Uncharacterized protein n=1 Tax=Salix dunnii TaxID=1413687 RepID=A0A835JCV6_9ROSI|nr:hypothetical protein SADUNF_Sadunf14G0046400 [Salix dunnii]